MLSVVIPTYNRAGSLARTLASIACQTLPPGQFDVILVDDGSQDETPTIAAQAYPFPLRCLRQANQGATAARNAGAEASTARALLFLDDDITLSPGALAHLANALDCHPRTIVTGPLSLANPKPPFASLFEPPLPPPGSPMLQPMPFTECLSGYLAIRRADYLAAGGMASLTGVPGPDAWCDVDFAYRAHLLGFSFVRCLPAAAVHHDQYAIDFPTYCRRCQATARSAVLLLHKHPGLLPYLPQFGDKTPITSPSGRPQVVLRKLARAVLAWSPFLHAMETLLARHAARPRLAAHLYRWTSSAYIYLGFRQGLREFGPLPIHT